MSKWTRNVGTPDHPVSYLHEYAVALIWDRLRVGGCFVKTTSSNEYEHISVPKGGRIAIPDELTPIGGMVPDIAIYDSDHRPVTVVEVQVTSSPSKDKMSRLERLGVKMVIVPVPNHEALLTMFQPVSVEELFHSIYIPSFYYGHTNLLRRYEGGKERRQANYAIGDLIRHLKMCDPALRQELRTVLDELDSIESQHPILPGNPKLPTLQQKEQPDKESA